MTQKKTQNNQPKSSQLILMVKGTRNKCTLSVHAQKGNEPLVRKRVEFHFGLDRDDPLPVCQFKDASGNPVIVETNENGLAYLPDHDFTGLDPQLTCVMATMVGATTKFQPLPAETGEPAYTFMKKVTRLKVFPEDDVITSRTGYITLTVKTLDENGNLVDDTVSVSVDVGFEIRDAVSGTVLDPANVSIPKSGRTIKVVPQGYSATCTVTQASTGIATEKKWQYQF